jgi:hypothetical protein
MTNKEDVTHMFAKLLGDETRDFQLDPITQTETQALIEKLFQIIQDKSVSDDMADFCFECLKVAKSNMRYN